MIWIGKASKPRSTAALWSAHRAHIDAWFSVRTTGVDVGQPCRADASATLSPRSAYPAPESPVAHHGTCKPSWVHSFLSCSKIGV